MILQSYESRVDRFSGPKKSGLGVLRTVVREFCVWGHSDLNV